MTNSSKLWTAMHFFFPYDIAIDPEGSRQHRLKARLITSLSPPSSAMNESARFAFNLFYITVHVFAFLNTLVYWGAEVPAGHGGFRPPSFPKHHPSGPGSNATIEYNPSESETWSWRTSEKRFKCSRYLDTNMNQQTRDCSRRTTSNLSAS